MMWILSIVGAFLSRLHGGGFFSLPKIIRNALWALPFGLVTFIAVLPHTETYIAILAAIFAFALCFVGKSTGHGRIWNPWVNLNILDKAERVEFVIKWLIGRIPDFWYKSIGLSLVGFLAVSGAAIAIGVVYPLAGVIIALGGLISKPIGYLIGFKTRFKNEIGELITGFGSYLALGYVLTEMI